ncbi:MAG: bifunctional phosphoribosyl-AMP cyclohydrolase/phosphoribosyl-ATP diphosphatase [Clostridiales bacterium GWB2_37_7]|nr:MAG: bifunctional phosphoribosyl-AMP cyclohydrolase/phosphoribosyl-ATP diphosphatase [Clostridiales bacterium GWB2_37_7]
MNIKYDDKGLIPVIVQDYLSGKVLMMAYMNKESLELTLSTGYANYYSRSRQSLWKKGETSGNVQRVMEISTDCDGDCLLLKVDQTGNACHTGAESCFFNSIKIFEENRSIGQILDSLYKVIEDRRKNRKEGSYTNYLFDKGIDKILKKVGEETSEVIIGAKNNSTEELKYEICDLIYHLNVLMVYQDINYEDIAKELGNRFR